MNYLSEKITYRWLIVAIGLSLPIDAIGQGRMRGHVRLPRTQGATVLSTYINASANRLVATGDFLESAAIARRIHLESDRVAMENSIQWIETYFERKRLNKEYREADRIDYLESRTLRNMTAHRRVTTGEVSGSPAEALNYMLRSLLGDENAYSSIFLNEKPEMSSDNLFLTPNDVSHIRIRSGSGGSFQLSKPMLVEDIWPKVFDRSEFTQIRGEYDLARSKVLREIDKGDLSRSTFEELSGVLMRLEERFDEVYQYKTMKDTIDLATLIQYKEIGRDFFLSQRTGALRAFASNDPEGYEMKYHFDGENLSDLLKYCAVHRLTFDDPDFDGSDTYAKLYSSLRSIYIEFVVKAPQF